MRWLAGILVNSVVPLGPRVREEVCEEAHRTSELTLFVALLQEEAQLQRDFGHRTVGDFCDF